MFNTGGDETHLVFIQKKNRTTSWRAVFGFQSMKKGGCGSDQRGRNLFGLQYRGLVFWFQCVSAGLVFSAAHSVGVHRSLILNRHTSITHLKQNTVITFYTVKKLILKKLTSTAEIKWVCWWMEFYATSSVSRHSNRTESLTFFLRLIVSNSFREI